MADATEGPAPSHGSPRRPLVLGASPGINPGRWVRTWNERYPSRPARVVVIEHGREREALVDGDVTLCFVRGDFADPNQEFHRVPLFEETQVVALPRDHVLAEWDTVDVADLRDEALLQPPEDVAGWAGSQEPALTGPALDAPVTDRLRMVADGLGVLVLPMSVARLHSRRDVVAVPVGDLPELPVGLVWPKNADPEVTQAFVGVVRGRTANSSRDGASGRKTAAPQPGRTRPSSGRRRR